MTDLDDRIWGDSDHNNRKGNTIYFPETSNIQCKNIGSRVKIHSHCWIGRDVIIGDDVRIQAFTFIPDGVRIGNRVFLGPRTTLLNDREPPSDNWLETIIEDDVSVGGGVVIVPGLTIGAGALIGAGSVVTHNVPPGEVWVGNPARFLRMRNAPSLSP